MAATKQRAETPPREDYLTVRETAAFVKLSEITIRRLLTQKKLKRFKACGRTLIRRRDAESLIREA